MRIKWTRRSLLAGAAALFSGKAFKALAVSPNGSADTWAPGMRPFSPMSPANLPLPKGTIYTPVPWDPSNGFNYYTGIKFYYDIPAPSVTTVVSWSAPAGWGNPAQTIRRVMTPGFTGHHTNDPDNEAVSFDGNNCLSIFNFTRTSDTTATSGAYGWCDIVSDTGFGFSSPFSSAKRGVGVVAAGTSLMLGALIKEEFTAGPINHMIALNVLGTICNAGTPNFYPPAISGDGNSGNGFIQEGQVMAIPPTTAMPSGLSIYGQKLFAAMQDYGCLVIDTGGANTLYCGVGTSNVSTSWTNNDIGLLIKDVNILIPLLYKTGFPLDGLLGVIYPYEACSPQLQLLRYSGPLMHVTRDVDGTGEDIDQIGHPSGRLNSSAIKSFCAGTTGRVSTYYGQVNGISFASAGSAAPVIYQSGAFKTINGNVALLFDGSSNYLRAEGSSANFPLSGQDLYLNAVVQIADYSANYAIFGSDVSGGFELRIDATTGYVRFMTNSGTTIAATTIPVPLNLPSLIEVIYITRTGQFAIYQNTVSTASGTKLVHVTNGNILLGSAGPGATSLFKGLIGEWLVCNGFGMPSNPQFSIANRLKNFWGTTGLVIAKDLFVDKNGTDFAAHKMNAGISGWTDLIGTHYIQSNSAQPNTLISGQAISTFHAGADGHYQCTLTPYSGNSFTDSGPCMVFRLTDANNFLQLGLEANNGAVRLYQKVAGQFTSIATLSMALVSGTPYVMDLYLSGSSIGFTVNGGRLTSVKNTFNQLATAAGIRSGLVGSPSEKCSYNALTFTV